MRVGVIGAGITGLALTHYLAERDIDVVTVEADSRPGGAIRSETVEGRLLEYGPQRIRLTPSIEALVDDLGLRDELLRADDSLPLYVYGDGHLRLVPRSPGAFLRTDLLSWRGKLRLLAEPLTDPARPDERAATLFRRKFGEEAYRNVVEPLFGGIYGSDPATMPVEHSLERLIALEERRGSLLRAAFGRLRGDDETPPPVSFANGLQTLPTALYEAHRPYVHLNASVDDIRDGDEEGYVLDLGGRTIDVDAVVVTTPAPAAASLLGGLSGAVAEPLEELTYNSLVLVHLAAEADAEGFGYQVRRDEPLETLGVTWNDGLFDRDGVYTVFLGGMHDPDAIDRSDAELGRVARREFRQVMGVDPELLSVTKLPRVMPAHDTSWAALEDVELPENVVLATNYTSRIGVPSRIREAKTVADRFAADD
ncbi:protoporphyrinogen oxidase [Haloterrigena alkaliphila]|uniref:Protoporphyrinogen oxidase n=1 Tax=Haloterrigena alkaliphila TaxID=2816475 RepID=A0A8A2VJS9_9EURY|nr:protoporphyrinogen oxidase [Haloterrigena alkaliphila]QSX00868.1 protoporphyrinogen oxidase [Haloterrigena alkaliphila]